MVTDSYTFLVGPTEPLSSVTEDALVVLTTPKHNHTQTVDVVLLGCLCNFDPLACVRNGILSLFVVVLGLLCLVRVARLVDIGRRYHQVAVFSLASVECLLITIHWLFMHYPAMELSVQLLKMAQLVIVCHFYLARSVRLLKREYLNRFLVLPVLVLFGAYFLVVTILGVIISKDQSISCQDPYWVMFSAVECVLVQMFMVCGIYITKKLNNVTMLRSQKRMQKRNIWSIIIAFELSSIATLIYDSFMLGSMDGRTRCSDVYNDNNVSYSVVYLLLMFFKIIVPILTLLVVFHPVDREEPEERLISSGSDSDGYSHHHRRLYSPGTSGHGFTPPPPPARSPTRRTQSFPRLPIITEEAEPHIINASLPISA
ncbi:uncharacterized protein LOC756386 [Strongylocentrotus purpuratus]|uniref:Uncharacterized protein n=1 Tax=Strongylocentrotus purpuratus TaxID=7668 RepID=A0A7M7G174_STRPU|nr:uncharacterized protein LOC756386 [Strongylocentrotus purpuratus]|eukprot:XP_001194806.2 PREDICTED: uncharacterized protein LOC756386 isoform X2 [Strongylocentrotus purpuratus]